MKSVCVNESIAKSIIGNNDSFLFDCDGVIWRWSKVFPGVIDLLKYLDSQSKRVFFLTNNSTRSRKQYVRKIRQIGYDVKEEQIVCTAWILAEYLKSINFSDTVYAVATTGVVEELQEANIDFIGPGPDPYPEGAELGSFTFDLNPKVKCVICAFDEHFSYIKVMKAASYARQPGCIFLASNEDPILPSLNDHMVFPGTGTIVASVKVAAGLNPIVVGKPHSAAWKLIKSKFDLNSSRTLMVGDRLETDIAFGRNNNMNTLAVFSGHTSLDEIETVQASKDKDSNNLVPHYYTDSLTDLWNFVKPQ